MKMSRVAVTVLLLAGLVGCRGQVVDADPAGPDESITLGKTIDVQLTDWLALPREQLAEMCHSAQDQYESTLKQTRAEADSILLLPKLRVPLGVPVLRKAAFDPKLGISIPPYYKAGVADPELALHLARHGDVEAGLKLAGSDNPDLRKKIEACRLQRNYPVEWTRLVGIKLQEAQLRMANGELEGATDLVLLHRQLRELLDKDAVASPLGADLLPIGQRALRDALVEWRDARNKLPLVADEVESTLKDWGAVPRTQPVLVPGAARAVVMSYFHKELSNRLTAALEPMEMDRAVDLLGFPVVGEEVHGILGWLSEKDQLQEVWFVYRRRVGDLFPETVQIAHFLVEQAAEAGPIEKKVGLISQRYQASGLAYDFTLTPLCKAFGAILRVVGDKAAPLESWLPKDPLAFGEVNLERSYKQTRSEMANSTKDGEPVILKTAESIQKIQLPLPERPDLIVVEKLGPADLLAGMRVEWNQDDKLNLMGFEKLCLPLWTIYGPSRMEGNDNSLTLRWSKAPLLVDLLLPYSSVLSPQLTFQDSRGNKDLDTRMEAARRLDDAARKARWTAEKPLVRLPRFLTWPALELGMTQEEATKAMPTDLKCRATIKTADGSFSTLFTGSAPPTATFSPQQLVLRFGPEGRLAEVRVRYQEIPKKATETNLTLLNRLRKEGGEPNVLTPTWIGLWTDMPASAVIPVYNLWQDDRTRLTYQADPLCSEVILTDCPLDRPDGVALPPLETCTRGIDGARLGDSRAEVESRWKQDQTRPLTDGGLVLFMPSSSPYDMTIVYFDNNKVNRVLARHRLAPTDARGYLADLQKVWHNDVDRLGVLRRVDSRVDPETGDQIPIGFSWNDDVTRVRAFGTKAADGSHRLFTEWRAWPIPVEKKASTTRK